MDIAAKIRNERFTLSSSHKNILEHDILTRIFGLILVYNQAFQAKDQYLVTVVS